MTLDLSVEEAERLLRALAPRDWRQLAETQDFDERIPVRVAFSFIGQNDVLWDAMANTLANNTFEFLSPLYELDGGVHLTRDHLQRVGALEKVDMELLQSRNRTAYILALYLKACLKCARERLGLGDGSLDGPSRKSDDGEVQPKWPIKIDFKDLNTHILTAARWRKTSLIVCSGHEGAVDTFFRYRNFERIDAKSILVATLGRRQSIEEVRENLRLKVVAAMKNGRPLHIKMGNTAVAFREQFCADGSFPKALFDMRRWNMTGMPEENREYRKIVTDAELESWEGVPGRLESGFFVVVTSDFTPEAAIEHLPPSLPHLDLMAIIELNPSSFEGFSEE